MSFNGAVTEKNMQIYRDIFNEGVVNPNGCTAKATFFVSHKYTNYSAVQVRLLDLLYYDYAALTKSNSSL